MKLIKELEYYKNLREDIDNINSSREYAVYKVTGPNTEKVYYGYSKGADDESVRKSFFVGANRKGKDDEGRGAQILVNANGGQDDLEFEILDVTDTEEQAFMARNEEREADSNSTTGSSYFPPHIHRSVSANNPEHMAKISMLRDLSKCKTAREAWAKKFFDTAAMKALPTQHNKQEVVRDLDTLNPREFSKKYNIPFVNV